MPGGNPVFDRLLAKVLAARQVVKEVRSDLDRCVAEQRRAAVILDNGSLVHAARRYNEATQAHEVALRELIEALVATIEVQQGDLAEIQEALRLMMILQTGAMNGLRVQSRLGVAGPRGGPPSGALQ